VSGFRERPLWTCPRCGAKFVGRNMWHGCGDYSVEGFLEGKGEHARTLCSLEDLDDELRDWVCQAYRLMGEQRRFDARRRPDSPPVERTAR
jgi:hypothetical protein